MIIEPTVFILGAGASRPYGYPTGIELREQICSSFVSDSRAYYDNSSSMSLEYKLTGGLDRAEEFVDKFYKSSISSIDLFLARNPEFMDRGKCAIAFRILDAESNSRFREDIQDRTQDWYSHLFWKLTEGLAKKDDHSRFCENNVSFITFNYDRSLEHFLHESLSNSFISAGAEKIKEQLSQIQIIHVFGQIAGLDWQNLDSKTEYRRDINRIHLPGIVKNLRIIYEESENPESHEAHELISNAQHIFFIGFGYAKENLKVLNIPKILNKGQNIYGTALDLTTKEIQDIQSIFPDKGSPPYASCAHIENMDCLMLLRQYL